MLKQLIQIKNVLITEFEYPPSKNQNYIQTGLTPRMNEQNQTNKQLLRNLNFLKTSINKNYQKSKTSMISTKTIPEYDPFELSFKKRTIGRMTSIKTIDTDVELKEKIKINYLESVKNLVIE